MPGTGVRLPSAVSCAWRTTCRLPHARAPQRSRSSRRALVGIEAALEQRPEDRRVDLRPVQSGCCQHRFDVGPLQRQRIGVVEQPAVEPGDRLEADPAAEGHHPEQLAGEFAELRRSRLRMAQHPREHVVRQQADVVGEHAEDEPVDEVRDRLRIVAAPAQCLRDRRERGRRALGERLPGLSRPQPNRIRERPLEPVAGRRVGQVIELELVRLADAVRPVGADPEPHHVGDDQQAAGSPAPASTAGAARRRRRGRLAVPCIPRRSGAVSKRPPSRRRPCPCGRLARSSRSRPSGRPRPASARRAAGTGR